MLRHLIGGYMRAFDRRRHIWGKSDSITFFLMIWMVFIFLISVFEAETGGDASSWGRRCGLAAVYLPMLLNLFFCQIHPVRPEKFLYLCPMSSQERRQYINGSYYFRVLVQMLTACTGILLLCLFVSFDLLSAVVILLNDLALSILIPFDDRESAGRDRSGKSKAVWLTGLMIAIAFLTNGLQYMIAIGMIRYGVVRWIVLMAVVLVQLPVALQYGRYVKQELLAVLQYEDKLTG